ncbi:hypothetical protein [Flectobacillus longus]|uniref:hypothetical protein n=1 Tax=Flectobacillus longus TaxID=2984207 RepID=UPI0024B770B0|nr:hypothetical protein [Flectobacillus longus]MDI9882650.1 hypothetical protein [Flectobacillus longus]
MKIVTVISIFFLVISLNSFAQVSQGKITVFNTTLKVKDIIGTTNLSTQKWSKDLPKVLVRNEDYYLKTIGSYREEYDDLDPNSLFNLVDKGNYPLLDEINMRFYEEFAIPKLKGDSTINKRSDFISFCQSWEKTTDFKDRKLLLFKNEFIQIGKVIQKERFQFVYAPYTLKQNIKRKINANLTADIKSELKANNIEASASLINHLSSIVTSQTEYSGVMIIAEFEDNYMTRLKNSLNGLSKDRLGNDDFSIGLRFYGAEGGKRVATTGLVVFKLNGKINKSRLVESNLKSDLKAKFKLLTDDQISAITTSMSIGFVRKVENLFSADIENIYIKSFLTSKKVDQIALDNTIKALVTEYDLGKDDGRNMGIIGGSLDRYYVENGTYPSDLTQLKSQKAISAINKIGALIVYKKESTDSYILTFAGEDRQLNTEDDIIQRGYKGKPEKNN